MFYAEIYFIYTNKTSDSAKKNMSCCKLPYKPYTAGFSKTIEHLLNKSHELVPTTCTACFNLNVIRQSDQSFVKAIGHFLTLFCDV